MVSGQQRPGSGGRGHKPAAGSMQILKSLKNAAMWTFTRKNRFRYSRERALKNVTNFEKYFRSEKVAVKNAFSKRKCAAQGARRVAPRCAASWPRREGLHKSHFWFLKKEHAEKRDEQTEADKNLRGHPPYNNKLGCSVPDFTPNDCIYFYQLLFVPEKKSIFSFLLINQGRPRRSAYDWLVYSTKYRRSSREQAFG